MTYNFERVELKNDNGQLYVILHMKVPNKHSYSTEFGSEFNLEKEDSFIKSAKKFVKKQFPQLKVATIVVIAGTTILTSVPLQKVEAHEVNFNMSYLYFGNTQSYISQIDKTYRNLNLVSPSYFDLNKDGSLKVTAQFDPVFIKEMHARGVKVVPFLSNHWDRTLGRAALKNAEKLSTQIADFIVANDLDGVQVDIENTTEIDRDAYTNLVRLLREKLPTNKEVSVAVAANPYGWMKGWHGTYDYKALAKYSSYLMIMAYDESYFGGPEGPVASYPWVERSVQYALNQGVPAEKVVLGVPFYGRYWKKGGTASEMGVGISNHRVEELLVKYGGTVTFDEKSKSPKATITIKASDPKTTIAGKTLTAGTYTIWYENDESFEAKFDLLHQYNLKGTGSWSLGQENTAIWPSYRTWLSHNDVEVAPHNPTPAPKEISYTVKFSDSLWGIARTYNMTVDEIKEMNQLTSNVVFVGQVLKVKNLDYTPITMPPELINMENPFTDIDTFDVNTRKEILNLVDQGIINGKTPTTFVPSDAITRGQVVKMLGRLLVNNEITKVPTDWETTAYFEDLSIHTKDRELLKYAAVVKKAGVFEGKQDGTLDHSGTISRENMALVLNRATKAISGQSLVEMAKDKDDTLADLHVAKIEAREAIRSLNALGISNVEKFNPKGEVKRVHFASFLSRAMEYMVPDK